MDSQACQNCHFPAGVCGRVRLIGTAATVFEFACGREHVYLNNTIVSPKSVFRSLVSKLIKVNVCTHRECPHHSAYRPEVALAPAQR